MSKPAFDVLAGEYMLWIAGCYVPHPSVWEEAVG